MNEQRKPEEKLAAFDATIQLEFRICSRFAAQGSGEERPRPRERPQPDKTYSRLDGVFKTPHDRGSSTAIRIALAKDFSV